MEREMCNYLDWELTVNNRMMSNFEKKVQRDFSLNSKGPFPIYSVDLVSNSTVSTSAITIPEQNCTGPILAFSHHCQSTMKAAFYRTLPPAYLQKVDIGRPPSQPFHHHLARIVEFPSDAHRFRGSCRRRIHRSQEVQNPDICRSSAQMPQGRARSAWHGGGRSGVELAVLV
ncbi:hypothetical protein B0H13DRAFT_2300768 [Mycena leptocephala]|nr:hypothetical protein B0H13DRAFT_2300768 [Mycena leptocephala]